MSEHEQMICGAVAELGRSLGKKLGAVTLEQDLIGDLGFESLDLAELVATLELKLGKNPFAADVAIATVKTVGDLARAYAR